MAQAKRDYDKFGLVKYCQIEVAIASNMNEEVATLDAETLEILRMEDDGCMCHPSTEV